MESLPLSGRESSDDIVNKGIVERDVEGEKLQLSPNFLTNVTDNMGQPLVQSQGDGEKHIPTPPSSKPSKTMLDARREKIKDILEGKTTSLHELQNELVERSKKNREERVLLAKQLNEIHNSHKKRERHRIEVERELNRLQQQNLVNEIMHRKQAQADYRSHLQTIESDEMLLLRKLEALDEERARRQAAKIASVEEVHNRFAPVLDMLKVEESDGKKQLEQIASQGTDNLDVTLARELQKNISEMHKKKVEQSAETRQQLTSQRFEVEAEVRSRTEKLKHLKEHEAVMGGEVPYIYGQSDEEASRFKSQMTLPQSIHNTTGEGRSHAGVDLLEQARNLLVTNSPQASVNQSKSAYKNYSFKNVLQKAKAMDITVQDRVSLCQVRLDELQTELNWIESGPQTEQWKNVTSRVRNNDVDKTKELLQHFVKTQASRSEYVAHEEDINAIDACVGILFLEILDDACREVAELAAKEILSLRVGAQRLLETLLVKSMSGLMDEDQANLHVSGKAHLLRGCARQVKYSTSRLKESAKSTIRPYRQQKRQKAKSKSSASTLWDDIDVVLEKCPPRTQYLVYGDHHLKQKEHFNPPHFFNEFYANYDQDHLAQYPIPQCDPKTNFKVTDFPSGANISLWKSMLEFDNEIEKQDLISHESSHFQGLALLDDPSSRIELPLPSELRGLCLLRCYARANKCLSLLIVGAKNGRFALYSVPWQAAHSPDVFEMDPTRNDSKSEEKAAKKVQNCASAPTLVSLSPRLPMNEVSPIVDMQETTMPSNQLISLDERGVIRVWCLNPISKRKTHSSSMFSRLYSQYNPVYASCTFYITPTEFNLPMPTRPSFFNRFRGVNSSYKFENGSTTAPQRGTSPQKVMLLPSCSALSGRTCSLMAGTTGGDIFKVNLDFKEKYFSPRFVHPPPFVEVEFMHSASVTGGRGNMKNVHMIQAAADNRKAAKGRNPIYRELFHYHTAPIILLECYGKVHRYIVSIDAEGKIALWAYYSELVNSQGWFQPLRTATLDLRYFMLTKLKVSPACPLPPQSPHDEVEKLLQPMKRIKVGTDIVDMYQPVRRVPNHPSHLEVYYERRSKESSDEAIWSAANVTTSLLSSGVLDAKMTPDGEEIVLLMTYEGLRDDGSGNVNLTLQNLGASAKLQRRQEKSLEKTTSSKTKRSKSVKGEKLNDHNGDIEVDILDEDRLLSLEEASLAQLDTVTDSEDENDNHSDDKNFAKENVEMFVRRTASDFAFWMRDREDQNAAISNLDRTEAQRELKGEIQSRAAVARHLSNVQDNEKRNLYGSAVNPTWNEHAADDEQHVEGEATDHGKTMPTSVRETTIFAVVACLKLDTWTFHKPLVEFSLRPNELVMGLHVGPVQSQTLTRCVFVQTSSQLRAFSLETGLEIISNSFPFTTESLGSSKKQFKPLIGALCPLQSMIALGDTDLSTVVLNKIDTLVPHLVDDKVKHSHGPNVVTSDENSSRKHDSGDQKSLPSSALSGIGRQVSRLRRVVHDLFVPLPVIPNEPNIAEEWLLNEIACILDEIFESMWALRKHNSRERIANAVLGSEGNLGVIKPTKWPVLTGGTMGNGFGKVMALYRGAEKWKMFASNRKAGESLRSSDSSSADDSSSEGESSEYESESSTSTISTQNSSRRASQSLHDVGDVDEDDDESVEDNIRVGAITEIENASFTNDELEEIPEDLDGYSLAVNSHIVKETTGESIEDEVNQKDENEGDSTISNGNDDDITFPDDDRGQESDVTDDDTPKIFINSADRNKSVDSSQERGEINLDESGLSDNESKLTGVGSKEKSPKSNYSDISHSDSVRSVDDDIVKSHEGSVENDLELSKDINENEKILSSGSDNEDAEGMHTEAGADNGDSSQKTKKSFWGRRKKN